MHIPMPEAEALAANLCKRAKMVTVPEAASPHVMEVFDQAVALGFPGRNEDQLNTDIQTQAEEEAKVPRGALPARGGRIIVQQQAMGYPQGAPDLLDMAMQTRAAFVRTQGLGHGLGLCIDGVDRKSVV